MNTKSLCLLALGLLCLCTIPAGAQDNLGDLIIYNNYDWLLGQWVASTDQGEKVEFNFTWGLDKHIVLVDLKMADFKYHGMIMFSPSREEITHVGADNKGGIWKGTWSDDYGDAVHRTEQVKPDGTTQKMEMVHAKVDADTMRVKMYGVDSSGYRTGDPWATLTYKRQPAKK